MSGLPATGSISLGTALVAGSILVPKPAAGITAFVIFRRSTMVILWLEEKGGKLRGGESLAAQSGCSSLHFRPRLDGFPLHLSYFQFRMGNQEMPDHGLKGFRVWSYVGGIDDGY